MDTYLSSFPGFLGAEDLGGSGSNRKYWRIRLENGSSVIGVEGTDKGENNSFRAMSQFFADRGINVPRVLGMSADGLCYIQEDLGDDVLRNHLNDDALLEETLRQLVRMQQAGKGFDYNECFATKEFGPRIMDFDLNYFKYCFLKVSGRNFDEHRLQDDFDRLRADLCKVPSDCFLYRDFQSRNIMIRDGKPWFIDFQGGFRGPYYYDLCSFIYQASAGFSEEKRRKLADAYYASLSAYEKVERSSFDANVQLFALFRCLQTLGAYGLRGLVERKQYFLDSIPAGVANLRKLTSAELGERYPYLKQLAYELDTYSL